ncbi:MAG: polynucleotide adenylyltransferase PcnB [Pseudomonadales bacterium]|nr:polynucleotide adenylyltransferase PcnB [Pseudomonadales bacterium]NIX09361.1 polynucleotide adenylyltransferase PcnB [Pseudomonadales bacterium]
MNEPVRLDGAEHGILRDQVDPDALDVTRRLSDAGYQALLVGGCVRDLLLGAEPKDFDVATDATPEEVRQLFRRSRLVGRRFRIAHVRYGRKVIEVSTFRRSHAEDEDERRHSVEGVILRDNVYGSLEEDAFRRDFTVNALFYDPETEEILDYVGGLEDLERADLRFIGEAEVRLREDPVRLLRAVRFQAKLNFKLDESIEAALPDAADMLSVIPPARLFDEIAKLMMSGSAAAAWAVIASTPLRAALFPGTPGDSRLVELAMANTDDRIARDLPVTPGFLLAVLMWHDYQAQCAALTGERRPAEARLQAAAETLAAQQAVTSMPRRFSQFVRDVWSLQARLETRLPRQIDRVVQHPRFRAAYDFLVLRAEAGELASGSEPLDEAAQWWTTYQQADQAKRADMAEERRAVQPLRKRRRRRRRG